LRRTVSLVVTLLLTIVVAATVVRAVHDVTDRPVVHGVVTPDVKPLFSDARVRAAFAHDGIDVRVDVVPDAELATAAKLSSYAFAVAPTSLAAQSISPGRKVRSITVAGSTPLAVETTAAQAAQLEAAGIASESNGRWTLNVAKFVAAPGHELTVSTPWPSASNALATFLVADAVDGQDELQTVADVDRVVNKVIPVFGDAGSFRVVPASTVVAADSVLLFPDPDVSLDTAVVAFDRNGARIASALAIATVPVPAHRVALPSADVLAALATRVGAAARIGSSPTDGSGVVAS
jgi:hypothetical protein